VIRSACTSRIASPGSNTACGTSAAPLTRQARMPALKPNVWKNGFTTRYRSAGVSCAHSAQARATPSDRSCDVIAPLLRPVVPEVNMMSLTSPGRTAPARRRACASEPASRNKFHSSGSRTIRPRRSKSSPAPDSAAAASRAPSRSTPRKSLATNSARAPLRPITSSASVPVNRVLTGTSAAPAPSAPSAVSTQQASFGAHRATLSPGSIPASISAPVTAVTRSSSSR
jgi:hypothetical protein